ncbi:exosome non-catalytic core subunit rrp46 [Ceratobasidium sp. 414]|nr:exosome non-catalytic core subunit rrp46 [Ceratobasidium sp. 414]
MSRPDGRKPNESRKVEIELGGLARVDGSARFSFGRALASVTGPVEVRQLIELPDRATFEVAVRPIAGVPATPEKALAKHIHDILRPTLLLGQHPRSLIQLTVLSLSPSPSPARLSPSYSYSRPSPHQACYAAAHVNAASLALLNAASIPMRGVVCAIAVGITEAGDPVLDPADGECVRAGCFAFFFSEVDAPEGEVVWADWKGATSKDEVFVVFLFERSIKLIEFEQYERATSLARAGAKEVLTQVRTEMPTLGGKRPDASKVESSMDLS